MNKYLFIFSFILAGCTTTEIKYDYSDREIKSIEYENVKGKFVPNIVFEDMMNKYIEWEYYNKKYGTIVR